MHDKKQEHTTHLLGASLVGKTHPRIELRGCIDSLRAELVELQAKALHEGRADLKKDLDEVALALQELQAAEVRDSSCAELALWGLNEAEIHERSHFPERYFGLGHILAHPDMGIWASALNRLRARVRETELCACRAFEKGEETERPDIIKNLNRLSSALYILIYKYLPKGYDKLASFARKA
ncbi:MAG: hypothetical protein GX256_02810 [Fretibacterium sp.]|nr:hypothetical protein [Fretibacterium sp.]